MRKKKSAPDNALIPFSEKMPRHSYSLDHIALFLTLILSASNGLRTAAKSFTVMVEFFQLNQAVPSWFTGRLWIMRLGYYKLNRPKVMANDWIWIIDFSVQLGKEKCLVILGIRQSDLPKPGQALRHQDMEPITLTPVTQANGEVVYQQLEKATLKTGIPRAIVSDKGSDINSGINHFCHQHRETVPLYDIKHHIAIRLKKRLEDDTFWGLFTEYAGKLNKELQQTEFSHLRPPALRTKARYMNLEKRIEWATRSLLLLDGSSEAQNPQREKLSGLNFYRSVIAEWSEMLQIAQCIEKEINTQGLSKDTPLKLALHFKAQPKLTCAANRQFRHELLRFLQFQTRELRGSERLVGSSEIIESVFGKQKYLEGEQAKSGFTGLLLAIPALVGELNRSVIKNALESTPVKTVWEWKNEFLGDNLQSRRLKDFGLGTAEQK
jgi:hypothetical protein